jgi:hypothetical protein
MAFSCFNTKEQVLIGKWKYKARDGKASQGNSMKYKARKGNARKGNKR